MAGVGRVWPHRVVAWVVRPGVRREDPAQKDIGQALTATGRRQSSTMACQADVSSLMARLVSCL